jgi:hypothetical protein
MSPELTTWGLFLCCCCLQFAALTTGVATVRPTSNKCRWVGGGRPRELGMRDWTEEQQRLIADPWRSRIWSGCTPTHPPSCSRNMPSRRPSARRSGPLTSQPPSSIAAASVQTPGGRTEATTPSAPTFRSSAAEWPCRQQQEQEQPCAARSLAAAPGGCWQPCRRASSGARARQRRLPGAARRSCRGRSRSRLRGASPARQRMPFNSWRC